jgi:hypothetical protein
MVRSIEHYPSETIVVVIARVRKAPKRVKNATVHDHELEVWEVHRVGELTENVPFTVYDAENINRDKEDVEDEDDESSLTNLFPSNGDTPTESTPKVGTPKVGTPRTSTDLSRFSLDSKSRLSKDNFASRSKCSI